MRKVCFVTSSRADYDLLYHSLLEFESNNNTRLQLVVTGSHLVKAHGYTIKKIQKDRFKIDKTIKLSHEATTQSTITNISKIIKQFSQTIEELNPDIIVVLGDRYEIFGASISAFINNVPIAHLHGGEVTLSAQDDAMRHGITKMGSLHFVSDPKYKKRVVQLGERPNSVFNVGPLARERIEKLTFLTKKEIEKKIKFKFLEKNLLVTYHPETLYKGKNVSNFKKVLSSLNTLKDYGIIFTSPNMDSEADMLRSMINDFVDKNNKRSVHIKSMGAPVYFSCMQQVDAIVGNSSSGIIEAPIMGIPSVNIGDRQTGRENSGSIIHAKPLVGDILSSIKKACSSSFRKNSKKSFPKSYPSKIICKEIMSFLNNKQITKGFYDL
tara:strand:+ start:18545 stop:19687 length:1143 start_codon:yes stop_codon:yes gene_type:complete